MDTLPALIPEVRDGDLLEKLPTAVYLCDVHGQIVRYNRRAAELWGREPRLHCGAERFCGAWKLYHPDGREMPREETPMAEAIRTGRRASNGRVVIERPNGTRITVMVNIEPLRDASGRITGAINSFSDATESVEMDLALRRSASELRARTQELETLMESVPAIVWISHDPESLRITGNRAASESLRLPPGVNHSLTAGPESPRHFRVFDSNGRELRGDSLPVQAAARGRGARNVEVMQRFDDGSERWLLGNAEPLRGEDGQVRGSIAAFVDITDRKKELIRSAYLQQASAILGSSLDLDVTLAEVARQAVRCIADWCAVYLLEGNRVRLVAVEHRDPTKVDRGRELSERHPVDLTMDLPLPRVLKGGPPEHIREVTEEVIRKNARSEEHYRQLKELGLTSAVIVPMRSRGRVLGAISLVTEAGRRLEQDDASLAEALGDRAGVAVDNALLFSQTARELKERRIAEEEVGRLNAELELRVRERTSLLEEAVEELNTFAYTVAHDLRAPIRAMMGFARILMEDYGAKLDMQGASLTRRIEESARRMDRLVADLLEYSRISRERLSLERMSLVAAVREAVRAVEAAAAASAARVEVASDLPEVVAHPVYLGRVLENLLSNAVKFVPQGQRPQVRVAAERRGPAVRVWVEDNGIGFSPEHGAKLFRIFERLVSDSEYPGTGMGLAIVRKAMERMNGSCGAESQPGRGARFWFELPAVGPELQGAKS